MNNPNIKIPEFFHEESKSKLGDIIKTALTPEVRREHPNLYIMILSEFERNYIKALIKQQSEREREARRKGKWIAPVYLPENLSR